MMVPRPEQDATTPVERVVAAARGDVHHLIQPIIGVMRWRRFKDERPTMEDLDRWIDRLYTALAVADAFGDEDARRALAGKHGLGLPSTPESTAAVQARLRTLPAASSPSPTEEEQ